MHVLYHFHFVRSSGSTASSPTCLTLLLQVPYRPLLFLLDPIGCARTNRFWSALYLVNLSRVQSSLQRSACPAGKAERKSPIGLLSTSAWATSAANSCVQVEVNGVEAKTCGIPKMGKRGTMGTERPQPHLKSANRIGPTIYSLQEAGRWAPATGAACSCMVLVDLWLPSCM